LCPGARAPRAISSLSQEDEVSMRLYLAAALALLAPLAQLAPLAPCGSENTGETSPVPETPAAPVAAEDFADKYATALCEREGACQALAPYLVDQCHARTLAYFADDIMKAIAAGRITFDEQAAGACIEGVRETPCLTEQWDDATLAACYKALRGTLEPGETCYAAFECAGGTCSVEPLATCPAKCPEVGAEGDSCSFLAGSYCNEQAGLRCAGGVCVKPAGEGGKCADNNGCKSGLVCVGGTCEPLRTQGAGCSSDASCAPGLLCLAEGNGGGLCKPRLKEGETCGATPDENNAALRGAHCQDGLVCKGAGLKSDGEPVPGTCATPQPVGGACMVEPDGLQLMLNGCLAGLHCPAGTCELLPSSGECAPHNFCQPGVAYCDAMNMCMPYKANGEACSIDPECGGGLCLSSMCADAVTFCHEP
jgi:hypothetical protein